MSTTVVGHAFSMGGSAMPRHEQLAHLIKNAAVLGGLVAMTFAAG